MNETRKVEIKLATVNALRDIAMCHRAAFPSSLSSALGLKYVMRMLAWYLESDNTFLFYLSVNGRCVGYCGGMVKTHTGVGSASGMAQFSLGAAVRAFSVRPWLLFHRELREKYQFIVKNLFRFLVRHRPALSSANAIDPYVGLVVIGVHPEVQGAGYGSLLLKEFERIATNRFVQSLRLTVKPDNESAIRAYLKNGWTIDRRELRSISMVKDLSMREDSMNQLLK